MWLPIIETIKKNKEMDKMDFYKLDERSHSHVKSDNINDNVYMKEEVLTWAKDVAKMNDTNIQVEDNVELAIEVLDSCGEYLKRVS